MDRLLTAKMRLTSKKRSFTPIKKGGGVKRALCDNRKAFGGKKAVQMQKAGLQRRKRAVYLEKRS